MKDHFIREITKLTKSPMAALIFSDIMNKIYTGDYILSDNSLLYRLNHNDIIKHYGLEKPVYYAILRTLEENLLIEKKLSKVNKKNKMCIRIKSDKIYEIMKTVKNQNEPEEAKNEQV